MLSNKVRNGGLKEGNTFPINVQLKILSWNVWYDGNFDEISKFLTESNADIIGLQEVVPEDSSRDIIGYLTRLGYNHVFVPSLKIYWKENDHRTFGNAIFSKSKIIRTETYNLSEIDNRKVVRADISLGEIVLQVFNTHLIHTHQKPSVVQEKQTESLAKLLPNERTILMGDFNATPDSAAIKTISKVLVDSDPSSAPTWCVYPEGCLTCNIRDISIRLDYIFTSKDLKTSSFKVGESKGSDHLPISVVVEI